VPPRWWIPGRPGRRAISCSMISAMRGWPVPWYTRPTPSRAAAWEAGRRREGGGGQEGQGVTRGAGGQCLGNDAEALCPGTPGLHLGVQRPGIPRGAWEEGGGGGGAGRKGTGAGGCR
jgi:hypothetical protein